MKLNFFPQPNSHLLLTSYHPDIDQVGALVEAIPTPKVALPGSPDRVPPIQPPIQRSLANSKASPPGHWAACDNHRCDSLAMASENGQPSISDHGVRQILATCLDGFSCSPAQGQMQLVRGLMRYNGFASRSFHQGEDSITEYSVRFKKNLCLFFRALHFFEEFHNSRKFPQHAGGFWGLIQQEVSFLFERPNGPPRFLWFLIDSRAAFDSTHFYTAIPGSHCPQDIHTLVLHWASVIRKSRETDSRQKQNIDAKRLTDRCSEWRQLLESGQLADRTDLSDIILESQDIGAIVPHTAHSEGALHTTPHRTRAGATVPLFKQERADVVNGTNSPIGEARKRRRGSPTPDSHKADGPDVSQREKRRRYVSPEPDNRNPPSPDLNLSPRNDGRFAGLDKRLSHALSLQLQRGVDITSLDSRLQSQTNQLGAISATVNRLSETVLSNRANLSALEEKVDNLALEERVTDIDMEQLKVIAVEALRSDLRPQLDAQLDDLVHTAISRIDIAGLVQTAVSRIPLRDLIQDAVSQIPIRDLIQDAVSRVTIDDEIPRRLEAMETQLRSHRRIPSPTRLAHRPQQPAPSAPAQNSADKARNELIIRTMAEKIEKLEAELGKAKAVGPPATPSRPSQPQPSGSISSPIKLEDSL